MNLKFFIYLYANCCPKVSKRNHKKISDWRCFPFALSCEYPREFPKKFETAWWYNQRLGGNWFMKKTRRKNLVTLPLLVKERLKHWCKFEHPVDVGTLLAEKNTDEKFEHPVGVRNSFHTLAHYYQCSVGTVSKNDEIKWRCDHNNKIIWLVKENKI